MCAHAQFAGNVERAAKILQAAEEHVLAMAPEGMNDGCTNDSRLRCLHNLKHEHKQACAGLHLSLGPNIPTKSRQDIVKPPGDALSTVTFQAVEAVAQRRRHGNQHPLGQSNSHQKHVIVRT